MYGARWVEVKLPGFKGSKFTPAQLEWFPKLCAFGAGVWVMTSPSEYDPPKEVLFKPPNWSLYLGVLK